MISQTVILRIFSPVNGRMSSLLVVGDDVIVADQVIWGIADYLAGETWSNNFEAPEFDSEETGWENNTLRIRVASPQISNTGLTYTRVTFQAGTSGALKLESAYIGIGASSGDPEDFESAPTPLLFSGLAGITIPVDEQRTSDEVLYTIPAGKPLLVSVYVLLAASDIIAGISTPTTGWSYYYMAGDSASVVNVTGYVEDTALGAALVAKVESR